MVSTSEIKFVLTRLGVELSDEELGEMVQVKMIKIVMMMMIPSNGDAYSDHVLLISIFRGKYIDFNADTLWSGS